MKVELGLGVFLLLQCYPATPLSRWWWGSLGGGRFPPLGEGQSVHNFLIIPMAMRICVCL